MIIDHLVSLGTQGRLAFDQDGAIAAKGHIQSELLETWLNHPYYADKPPKSTGRELFGTGYSGKIYQESCSNYSLEDIVATATALTAQTIIKSYQHFLPQQPDCVYVSGGGVHNQTLMNLIRQNLTLPVLAMEQVSHLSSDAKEAFAFACLAYTSLFGIANNLPSVTGASQAIPLGKLIPGQNYLNLLKLVNQALSRV